MGARAFLRKFASRLARSHEETRQIDDPVSARAKIALFAGMGAVFGMIFVPFLMSHTSPWRGFHPDVRVPHETWNVLLAHGVTAANVESALWRSPLKRSDPDHTARLAAWQGERFWIGTRIDPSVLSEAYRARANHFALGRFNAFYRIWIDGRLMVEGEGRGEAEPVIIPLPMERLAVSEPLRIVISIDHTYGHYAPDLLNSLGGGVGFLTPAGTQTYRGLMSFWSNTRPLAFSIAYFTLAVLFFFLWRSSPREQEFYYVAIHLLVASFLQLRQMDVIDLTKQLNLHFGLGLVLEFYKAAFGMFMGLSFARTRRSVFKWGVPAAIAAPLLILPFLPGSLAKFVVYNFVRKWLVAPFYLAGATACAVQAVHLLRQRRRGSYLPVRITRLFLFAAGLAFVAAIYAIYAHSFVFAPNAVQSLSLWLGMEHYAIVLFLGYIAAAEIRHRALLSRTTPISAYHRRSRLPERVEGVLLVIDLKCSEPFYKDRAANEESEDLVGIWRSHVYAAAARHGGVIIHKKGDEVAVLFDRAALPHAAASALAALRDAAKASRILERDFSERALLPPGAIGFRFRAALSEGALKPGWEAIGSEREPTWEELPESEGLKKVARYFQQERGISGKAEEIVAVVPRELLAQESSAPPEKIGEDRQVYIAEAA
jgi:hypothetical protein